MFSSPGHSVVVRVDCTQLNITTSDSSDALDTLYTGTFGTSQFNCDGISVTLHSSLHHNAVLWSEDDGIVHTTQFCTSLQVLLSLSGGGEWLDWLLSVHLSPGRPTIGRYHHHITQRHTQPNKDGLLKAQPHNSDNNTIQNRESFSKCIGLGVRRTIPTFCKIQPQKPRKNIYFQEPVLSFAKCTNLT